MEEALNNCRQCLWWMQIKFNHSVFCHSPVDAVEFDRLFFFSYVYPVYLFTFIDYLDVFLLYLYTVVLGFVMTLSVYCKPNKMVMMLLLHCWYILTCRFNTKNSRTDAFSGTNVWWTI